MVKAKKRSSGCPKRKSQKATIKAFFVRTLKKLRLLSINAWKQEDNLQELSNPKVSYIWKNHDPLWYNIRAKRQSRSQLPKIRKVCIAPYLPCLEDLNIMYWLRHGAKVKESISDMQVAMPNLPGRKNRRIMDQLKHGAKVKEAVSDMEFSVCIHDSTLQPDAVLRQQTQCRSERKAMKSMEPTWSELIVELRENLSREAIPEVSKKNRKYLKSKKEAETQTEMGEPKNCSLLSNSIIEMKE